MKRRILPALLAICLAVAVLAAAIAVPIHWRGFYYGQIEALDLPAQTGWSEETIRTAFDQVMDFLLQGAPFGTGELRWSESGRAHFADCRVLFRLDGQVLLFALVVAGVILLAARRERLPLHRPGRLGPCFWAGVLALVIPVAFGVLLVADFDRAFTLFHTVFFPGKDNWIFDAAQDEIIRILPARFFARCAALIGAADLLLSGELIGFDLLRRRRERRTLQAKEE